VVVKTLAGGGWGGRKGVVDESESPEQVIGRTFTDRKYCVRGRRKEGWKGASFLKQPK
jgi:hypothetical protein